MISLIINHAMDIFKKDISVKGILKKLLSLPEPIVKGLRFKYEEESELHRSFVPRLIRIKNN